MCNISAHKSWLIVRKTWTEHIFVTFRKILQFVSTVSSGNVFPRISAFLRWFLSPHVPKMSPKPYKFGPEKVISAPPTNYQNEPWSFQLCKIKHDSTRYIFASIVCMFSLPPPNKTIRTSKQSVSTSWQCNTSGNRHQPATHMGTCAWSACTGLSDA